MTVDPASNPSLQPKARTPFKRRGRIVLSLLAVLILVGLGPLATMAFKLIGISREALATAHQQNQLLLVSSMAHEVDIQVDALRSQLLRAAHALGTTLQSKGSLTEEDIRRDLAEFSDETMPYLRYSAFQRGSVTSIAVGELPEPLERLFTAGLQHAAEVLAEGPKDAPALLSDPILLDEPTSPRAVIAASAPVVSGGAFRGVLSALVDLQTVWDGVARRSGAHGHVIFALDENGSVFASSDPHRVPPGGDISDSPLVQRFLSGDGRGKETMPFALVEEGQQEDYLGSYELTQQGWGIFVQARKRQLYWSVADMRWNTLKWASGALALAGLGALFFARSLSEPVNKLAAVSRAFAQGNHSARAALRTRNEIGELGHTFNVMADEIELYIRALKQALEEKEELFRDTIRAMAQAIDAKDPYTRGHSDRVNRYSKLLAEELQLSEAEMRDIDWSSQLHDVGKIGIDDSILNKNGPLTETEFSTMKRHTVLGASIMEPIRQMKNIIPGLRSHHERWNGAGYPDGLAGDRIPLMARIIAVADTFDAITTNRPYQKKMSFEQALARLNEIRGSALDAEVVEAFNSVYQKGLIREAAQGSESFAVASLGSERLPLAL